MILRAGIAFALLSAAISFSIYQKDSIKITQESGYDFKIVNITCDSVQILSYLKFLSLSWAVADN